jgi:hypothetical protein
MGPIKMGLVKCFNLENKALEAYWRSYYQWNTCGYRYLDENIISYDQMASVTKQEMVEAFKNDDAQEVQLSIALNVSTKGDEVTINWNSSVQKKYSKAAISRRRFYKHS